MTIKDTVLILVMSPEATKEQIASAASQIETWGHKVSVTSGEEQTIIGIIGDKRDLAGRALSALDGVEKVLEVSAPYKLASRHFHPDDTIIDIRGVKVGGGHKAFMAGPCSVDNYETLIEIARAVKAAGANMLRGGAFKPRTSPYTFQGGGEEALKMLADARDETGLPIVTELMSERDIDVICKYADVIQLGARNMQNFSLLKEVGKLGMPVLLKNGIASTVQEHLMSAEYLMSEGLKDVMMCLRGTRGYETALRNAMDVAQVPLLKTLTHLPVIIDPSHAAGKREYVMALGYAGMAAGADGFNIEVHPNPKCALSDGEQALLPSDFDYFMKKIKNLDPWNQKEWSDMAHKI